MAEASENPEFWNSRYKAEEYVYGTAPNDFLAAHTKLLPTAGRILTLAEGEGRNAVFLAGLGYKVSAMDFSQSARKKALHLATEHEVSIDYSLATLEQFDMGQNHWDGVVSIFCHPPSNTRKALYQRIQSALRPGGVFLLESYNKAQLNYNTGGPNHPSLLMSLNELTTAFQHQKILLAQDLIREVQEGKSHTGHASVTQFIARKTT